ncbi:hypothetical protein [Streptomyces morookaense]|uniref:Uncharacterized protein n=1 Tax=Streptomyces morookaense TaxID=1970 RepID=A0A7Y7BB80_STRMO|nr:hypothetical protein [Streptomyces morookaense]NVK81956.1 hypothetical protein [Streptomyces morookaense]GHF39371.1 hypothetical protein GCM10010359_47740 [Streptomyces morookaense]
MNAYLGPLERTDDGRWVIGDPGRQGGSYLVLGTEGVYLREAGRDEELIAWSRFMGLSMTVTPRRWSSSRAAGVLNIVFGGSGGWYEVDTNGSCLQATLRHPYTPWVGRFSHHERRYSWSEILLADALLGQAVGVGAAQLLGDPDRLGQVVGLLAPLKVRTHSAARAAVAKALAP